MLNKFGMTRDQDGSIKTIFKNDKGEFLDSLFVGGENKDSIVISILAFIL